MLPENTGQLTAVYEVYPSKTYCIDLENKRICGYVDGTAALRQAIYKILATIRFEYIIYSDNYGTRLVDYADRLTEYVWAEIEDCIREGLMRDDRINAVTDFDFEENKREKVLYVSFTVQTDEAEVECKWEIKQGVIDFV
jgi:phage baseplate assembly protein W